MHVCSICYKEVKKGQGIKHEVCGHLSHGWCLDQENPDFDHCYDCKNNSNEKIATKREIRPLEVDQPRSYHVDGRDYIADPLPRKDQQGVLANLASKLTMKENTMKNALKEGLPLKTLVAQYGCYLQAMLAHQVTIDDFIHSGYTFKDMQDAYSNDLGENADKDRYIDALYALNVTPDHFRSKIVPVDKLATPRDIIEQFGLVFPGNCGNLVTNERTDWTLAELCDLGFTVDDVFGAGLQFYDQLEQLEPTRRAGDLEKMGFTQQDIDDLPIYKDMQHAIYQEVEFRPQYIEPVQTARTYTREPRRIPKPKPIRRKHHGLRKK